MPVSQPVGGYDVQTKESCMHVLSQAATATETGALKEEFQMITWEKERRGLKEFGGMCVRVVPRRASVYFHVQVCLRLWYDIRDSKEVDQIYLCAFLCGSKLQLTALFSRAQNDTKRNNDSV